MRKKDFGILVSLTILVVFAVTAVTVLFVFDFYNFKSKEQQLVSLTEVFSSQIKTQGIDDFKESFSNNDSNEIYVAIYSTSGELLYAPNRYLQIDGVYRDLKNSLDFVTALDFDQGASSYTFLQNDYAFRSIKIIPKNSDKPVIVRVGVKVYSSASLYAIVVAITGIILFISVYTAAHITRGKSYDAAMRTFLKVELSLDTIKKGEKFTKIMINPEDSQWIKELQESINTIGERINNIIHSLKNSEERNTFIINNMEQAFFVLSESRQIIIKNKAAVDLIGENVSANTSIIDFFHGSDKDLICSIFEKRENIVTDIVIKKKICRMSVNFFNINESSNITELDCMILVTDIDTRRKIELMKDEFFTNASHELKTPITAIKGYNEILLGKVSGEIEQKCVQEIDLNIVRMEKLIMSMLNLMKFERLQFNDEDISEKVKIRDVVEQCYKSLEGFAASKNIDFSIIGDGELFINLKAFEVMVENLIVNAIKYNKQGGKVVVEIESFEAYELIKIKDTGIGMSKEQLDRVFEKFYVVAGENVDSGLRSSGLGLPIIKKIVDSYGGEIEIVSTEGEGTEVIVKMFRGNKK